MHLSRAPPCCRRRCAALLNAERVQSLLEPAHAPTPALPRAAPPVLASPHITCAPTSAPPAECLGAHNYTAPWQTLLANDAHTMHNHTTKTYATLQHDKHSPQKKATLTFKTYGALQNCNRSHQKKTALPKIKGTLLLKLLAAFCVLDNVGAVNPFATPAPSPTCGCSAELQALSHVIDAKLEYIRQFVGIVPTSSPPSPPPPSPPALQRLVVCGSPGRCSETARLRDQDELHEVRLQCIQIPRVTSRACELT